jgi:hypothetical protein
MEHTPTDSHLRPSLHFSLTRTTCEGAAMSMPLSLSRGQGRGHLGSAHQGQGQGQQGQGDECDKARVNRSQSEVYTPRWKENFICLNYLPLYKRRLHNLDKNFWFQYYNVQNLFLKTYKSLNNRQYISQINELLKSKLINFFIFNDFFWKITDTIAFILEFSNELKDYDKNIKQPHFLRMKYLNTNYLINNNLIHNYLNFKKTYRDSKISYNKQRFLKTCIYLKIKKNRNLWFFQLLFFLVGSNLLTVVEKFDFKQYIKKQILNYDLTLKNAIDQISSYLENKMTAKDFLFRGLSKKEKNSNSSKFVFFVFCTEFINKNCALYNPIGNSKTVLMNHYFTNHDFFLFMQNSEILFKKTLISFSKANPILSTEFFFSDIHLIFNFDLFQNRNLFFATQNDSINFEKISFILEYNSVLFFIKNFDLIPVCMSATGDSVTTSMSSGQSYGQGRGHGYAKGDYNGKQNLEINLNFKIKMLTLLIEKASIFQNFISIFIFLLLNLLFLDYFIKNQQRSPFTSLLFPLTRTTYEGKPRELREYSKTELKLEYFWKYLIFFPKNQFLFLIFKHFLKMDFQSILIQLLKKLNLLVENLSDSNSKKETFFSNYQFQYMMSNNFLFNYLIMIRTYLKQNKSQSQKKILENVIIIQKVFLTHFQSFLSTKQLSFCDKEVRKALWRWACRRHSNKSHEWVKNRYFQLFHFNNRFFRLFCIINKNSSFCYPCHYDYLKSKSLLNLCCKHFFCFNQKYQIEVFEFVLIKIKKGKTKKNINTLILSIYTPCRT